MALGSRLCRRSDRRRSVNLPKVHCFCSFSVLVMPWKNAPSIALARQSAHWQTLRQKLLSSAAMGKSRNCPLNLCNSMTLSLSALVCASLWTASYQMETLA